MLPNNVFHISGKKKGPKVVILGAIHGNEKIGVEVIQKLKTELHPQDLHGEIFLILGNTEAYQKNVRYIDADLNRLFSLKLIEEVKNIPVDSRNNEQKRLLEIAPVLEKSDFVLDIHSTIKPSVPFVYTADSERHFELARLFQTPYILSAGKEFRKSEPASGCTDNFVNQSGGIAITYEAGWQQDTDIFDRVFENVKKYLGFLKVAFLDQDASSVFSGKLLSTYKRIVPQSDDFSFVDDFYNFHFFPKGSLIAHDKEIPIIAERDSSLLFPKANVKKGESAGLLAFENRKK